MPAARSWRVGQQINKRLGFYSVAEYVGSVFQRLAFAVVDLIGLQLETFAPLSHCLVFAQGSKGASRLECQRVRRTDSSPLHDLI
jgi:hypothetical protein